MKRITPISICRIVVFSIMAVACQKENLDGKLIITAERMGGDGKVAVSGRTSEWVDGDRIRINDQTKTISVSDGLATIDNTTDAVTAPYRAVYPETLVAGDADLTASVTATVTIPNEYNYVVSNSKQIVGMPMAACASSGSELKFKHLTAAVAIKLTNSFGGSLTIDEIAVQSDVSQICGSRTVDFSDESALTSQTANDAEVAAEQKRVRMVFADAEGRRLVLGNSETEYVVVPVLPVSSSNHFTVIVKATYGGKQYVFAKTQTSGGALARNEMGYVPVAMSAGNEDVVDYLIETTSEYNTLVSNINGRVSGYTGNVRVTINGTIDFEGATVDPINLAYASLTINGINNATIKNLTMNGNSNNYGLVSYVGSSYSLAVNNLTVENMTLPGTNGNTLSNIGAICASTSGDVSLSGCKVKNITVGTNETTGLSPNIGGFIGYINATRATAVEVSIDNCRYLQDVTPIASNTISLDRPRIGGLIGYAMENYGKEIHLNINDCNINSSTSSGMNATLSISGYSNNMHLAGLIGSCSMYSIDGTYSNLKIKNTSVKTNFSVTKNSQSSIYIGGMIGNCSSTNYPSNSEWNGNSLSGTIQYSNNGTDNTKNVKQIVGTLEDYNFESGITTLGITISTL